MKVYVSYVIQEDGRHKHDSTCIEITCPPYNYSLDLQAYQILDWAKSEKSKLKNYQKIIITNMYKV
ncbi:MAG: hypothetical protein KAQ79_17770 [Cyclobacteriaceae bacterium]|nr:hypothetical protein [Cyclobacteriaceae bacterium]